VPLPADVGVQQAQQRVEVTVTGGREERIDHLALFVLAGPAGRRHILHLAAGTAGQHFGRIGRLVENRPDLGEGHREEVVQHERQPFIGAQRAEHHEQCQPHRVREHRGIFGGVDVVGHDEFGEGDFGAAAARPQHVDTDPADDGGQPAGEIVDGARVLTRQPQPGLLDGVFGLRSCAQHAVGDREQSRALSLEVLRQLCIGRHVLPLAARIRHSHDGSAHTDVTTR
jgi:hypothetical protein